MGRARRGDDAHDLGAAREEVIREVGQMLAHAGSAGLWGWRGETVRGVSR